MNHSNEHRDPRMPVIQTGRLLVCGLVFAVIAAMASDVQAQRPGGANTGIGIQFGQPSGLTLKHYTMPGRALDLMAAWDLDRHYFFQGHYLFESHFPGSQSLHYYFGPGGFVGIRDHPNRDNDVDAGFSLNFGIAAALERLEFYGQVTPRLSLVPSTETDIGAGVGLRFYF